MQEDSNYESKKKGVIYNVQVLYEDRVRRWSRHIRQRRRRVELQIDLVPRAPEQLPHIVKRANLTRLPGWVLRLSIGIHQLD